MSGWETRAEARYHDRWCDGKGYQNGAPICGGRASKRSSNPGEQFCQRCACERAGTCDYCGGAIPHASDAQFSECAAKANKAARGGSR